jgi:hypothetical protein
MYVAMSNSVSVLNGARISKSGSEVVMKKVNRLVIGTTTLDIVVT